MDYLIVDEFNRFWELFAVNERLYPHRRACTLNLWMKMPQEKRSAIIEELERYGPPPTVPLLRRARTAPACTSARPTSTNVPLRCRPMSWMLVLASPLWQLL